MRAKYYHYRNFDNAPVITQCLLLGCDGEVVAVGNSICSPDETPCKKVGREQAYHRALCAYDDAMLGQYVGPDQFVGYNALYTLSTVNWERYIYPHHTVFLYGYIVV